MERKSGKPMAIRRFEEQFCDGCQKTKPDKNFVAISDKTNKPIQGMRCNICSACQRKLYRTKKWKRIVKEVNSMLADAKGF